MSIDLAKYAFVAGEISPTLFGRSDLEKYDLGLALARNWFVDYRGGLSTRPGTEFVDFVQHDDQETRFFPFKFAPNLANTYLILFGDGYIRFIQDGGYVLEDDISIHTITQASPGVVTAFGHGLSNGDWGYFSGIVGMVELNDVLAEVSAVTTDTFTLLDQFGDPLNTSQMGAYVSNGVFNRIYTLASPYDPDDLPTLKAYQRRDTVRLTHPDYATRNLVRTDATDWALTVEDIGNGGTAPTGLAGTPSAAGTASVGFMVTAIVDGEESLPSAMVIVASSVDYAATAGSVNLVWTAVAGAEYYNVYRTKIQSGAGASAQAITKAEQVGYIGRAYGPIFIDNNIIPDFTVTPPEFNDPFANGAILEIAVTAGGTGWNKATTTVAVSGSGSGFTGYPIVNNSGVIVGVVITNPGSGYVNPVVTFPAGGGSGATATATAGELTGNDPAVSAIFQQRQIYAATHNQPLTVFASRPGLLSNHDVSPVVTDADAWQFDIESEEVAPIEHLIPTRGGLLVISQAGIWLLTSGGTNQAITPTQALADPQSYRGCSSVKPLAIDTDILYIEGKSPTVRLLSYSELAKVYGGQDMSILSNHLFSPTKEIVRWGYAQNPFNLVVAVRSDGTLLIFTLVKEQDVYAWTSHQTKGLFLDLEVVEENGLATVYLMVKRFINGRWTKFIERLASRNFTHVEQAWCVDCGVQLVHEYPAATLTPGAATGSGVTFTASAAVFASGDVGKVIRGGGGRGEIVQFNSATEVLVDIDRDLTLVVPEDEDNLPLDIASGDWYMDEPVTELSVPHLKNQPVSILADGNVVSDKTVDAEGNLTLAVPATEIVVGLKYQCVAQTLPPTTQEAVIEGKRKRVVGAAVRVNDTRGLKVGDLLDNLYPFKERTTELPNEPILLQSGPKYILIDTPYNEEGQTYFVQDYPLPATILGIIADLEVGDDSG